MKQIWFIEAIAVGLFVWAFLLSKKQTGWRAVEFVMIFIYALILEELDMRIFKTYQYSADFVVTLGQVPVAIALLWAVILSGSMALTDRIGLPASARPFLDALLAVWIDLALDAIAIRMQLWTWAIPLEEGWFGVPAGNLYAWMWVAFCFTLPARWIRDRLGAKPKIGWAYLGLPIVSYVGLFVCMGGVGSLGNRLGLTTYGARLWLFWGQFAAFAFIVRLAWKDRRRNVLAPLCGFWSWSRLAMHVYFLGAYLLTQMYLESALLGLVALLVLAGEIGFFAWVRSDSRQH